MIIFHISIVCSGLFTCVIKRSKRVVTVRGRPASRRTSLFVFQFSLARLQEAEPQSGNDNVCIPLEEGFSGVNYFTATAGRLIDRT